MSRWTPKIIAALEKSKGKIICMLTQSNEKYFSVSSAEIITKHTQSAQK